MVIMSKPHYASFVGFISIASDVNKISSHEMSIKIVFSHLLDRLAHKLKFPITHNAYQHYLI